MKQTVADRRADADVRADRRARRYRGLEFWRQHTVRDGGRFCMFPRESMVRVSGTADGQAHASGLKRCGSPWICRVCTPTIREGRAAEIDAGVSEHLAGGGTAWLVSATFSHHLGDDLADLMDMGQRAYSYTWSQMSKREKERHGYVGQIRAWDTTYGRSGWHPHFHTIVLIEAGAEGTADWLRAVGTRWANGVDRVGGSTVVGPGWSPGWDVRPVVDSAGMSDYLCKVVGGWGAGLEVARSDLKRGRRGGRTPAELFELALDGNLDALELCRQYERATVGRRAIVWGRGLKARFGIEELDDEELAAAEPSGVITVEVVLPAKAWRRLLRTGEAASLLGVVGLMAAGFDPNGDAWRWPPGWILAWRPSSAIGRAA